MFQGREFRSRRANLAAQREDASAEAAARGYHRDQRASSGGGGFARGGNAQVGTFRTTLAKKGNKTLTPSRGC